MLHRRMSKNLYCTVSDQYQSCVMNSPLGCESPRLGRLIFQLKSASCAYGDEGGYLLV